MFWVINTFYDFVLTLLILEDRIIFILYLNNNIRNKYCTRSENYLKWNFLELERKKSECTKCDNLRDHDRILKFWSDSGVYFIKYLFQNGNRGSLKLYIKLQYLSNNINMNCLKNKLSKSCAWTSIMSMCYIQCRLLAVTYTYIFRDKSVK